MTTGLRLTARRPWLLVIPVLADLFIWLAPPIAVTELLRRFLLIWEGLLRAATPSGQLGSMQDMLKGVREMLMQAGVQINLVETISGNWLNAPSAVASAQSTRLTFISDMILAPVGIGLPLPRIAAAPWQGKPIEVKSFGVALLIVLAFWLVGQVLVALYLWWATAGWPRAAEDSSAGEAPQTRAPGGLRLLAQLMLFSILLGLAVFVLRLPLGAAVTLMVLSGSPVSALLFAAVGGITLWALLWFLISVFFVSEAMLLDGQPLWRSGLQSVAVIRGQGLRMIALIITINLLMVGFRAVWGILGQTPGGAVVAIVGNAFLATSMLLAVFAYYEELHRLWRARRAQARSNWDPRVQMRE